MTTSLINMESVINFIDNIPVEDFPKSIILFGETGSGRRTVCKYIADRLNNEFREVQNLNDIYDVVTPTLFVIDYSKLKDGCIQSLLKAVEEPPQMCRVAIVSESENTTIATIKNRCIPITIPKYSSSDLLHFTNSELVARFCKTPGMAMSTTEDKINEVMNWCGLIITKMCMASLSNALTLTEKVDTNNDDVSKINIPLFCRIMPVVAEEYYKKRVLTFTQLRVIMGETEELRRDMQNPSYNKRQLFDGYIVVLKGILK